MSPLRRAALGGGLVLAALTGALPFACGDLGVPAFQSEDGGPPAPSATTPAPSPVDGGPDAPVLVRLDGAALGPDGAGIPSALVAIEVGGLDQPNPGETAPDGAVGRTLKIDPYYQYGTLAGGGGDFSVLVPKTTLGVHVYVPGFYCGVPQVGALGPDAGFVTVSPVPLPNGASSAKPVLSELDIRPDVAIPGEPLTIVVRARAGEPKVDPLSEQVVGIEPVSGWSGLFAPPRPGSDLEGYPDGVYGRLTTAPLVPGVYTYYVVAATRDCVVGDPVSKTVIVTNLDGALPDGVALDAPQPINDGASDAAPEAAGDGSSVDGPPSEG